MTTPSAAPIDRRFMIAAFTGTSSDRNTTINKSAERRTTIPMNTGSFDAKMFARSIVAGVKPPISVVVAVCLSSAGTTVSLKWFTRSVVAASCGAVVG